MKTIVILMLVALSQACFASCDYTMTPHSLGNVFNNASKRLFPEQATVN